MAPLLLILIGAILAFLCDLILHHQTTDDLHNLLIEEEATAMLEKNEEPVRISTGTTDSGTEKEEEPVSPMLGGMELPGTPSPWEAVPRQGTKLKSALRVYSDSEDDTVERKKKKSVRFVISVEP